VNAKRSAPVTAAEAFLLAALRECEEISASYSRYRKKEQFFKTYDPFIMCLRKIAKSHY
jgi:hypothetical protein